MQTVGYAIPYHTNQLLEKLGFGFGLISMQGREARHVKLAMYVENTCNVKKSVRWWIVFHREFVCLIWLREMDPYSVSYREEQKVSDSYCTYLTGLKTTITNFVIVVFQSQMDVAQYAQAM